MKIKTTYIAYDITDEDVECGIDYFLETTDLCENKDLNVIKIEKQIVDNISKVCLNSIVFTDLNDRVVYYYNYIGDTDTYFECELACRETYEQVAEYIASELDQEIEFTINDSDFESQDELEELIANLISDYTDYLIEGYDYEIVED